MTRQRDFSSLSRARSSLRLDPSQYLLSDGLAHAVEVALVLGIPLLVTGEPGVGKTQLGFAVAEGLRGQGQALSVRKFETKSTSVAKDLFYTFDFFGRYNARDTPGTSQDARDYIAYSALGAAILDALSPEQAAPFLGRGVQHLGPRRSVVIVDEIDKAPRDFPNDLLNELERMAFRVPELGNISTPGLEGAGEGVPVGLRPVVIITSNSERALPDPFLRRCAFFHIPFPSADELREIVVRRIEGVESTSPLVEHAVSLFIALRTGLGGAVLRKRPGTAELLNWLQVLSARGFGPGDMLHTDEKRWVVQQTFPALIKLAEDVPAAGDVFEAWRRQQRPA